LGSNIIIEDSAGSKEGIDEGGGGEWKLGTRRTYGTSNKDILGMTEKYYIFILKI
jgi:hypothetical protein